MKVALKLLWHIVIKAASGHSTVELWLQPMWTSASPSEVL